MLQVSFIRWFACTSFVKQLIVLRSLFALISFTCVEASRVQSHFHFSLEATWGAPCDDFQSRFSTQVQACHTVFTAANSAESTSSRGRFMVRITNVILSQTASSRKLWNWNWKNTNHKFTCQCHFSDCDCGLFSTCRIKSQRTMKRKWLRSSHGR